LTVSLAAALAKHATIYLLFANISVRVGN